MTKGPAKEILLVILLFLLLPFLRLHGPLLEDLTTGTLPQGVTLENSPVRYLLDPVYWMFQYGYSMKDPLSRLSTFLFWAALIPGILVAWRRKNVQEGLRVMLLSFLSCVSIIALMVILPVPMVSLKAPAGWIKLDTHSHTWRSWDGIISPSMSMIYHQGLGYDCFFVTDHNRTEAIGDFPPAEQYHAVFPGTEIDCDGTHLLILADRSFPEASYVGAHPKDVIEGAHRDGFLAIAAHSFDRDKNSQLAMAGIDGFEVFDSSVHGITPTQQAELIRFCKERNLLMVGGSDFHGWGYASKVWTLVKKPPHTEVSRLSLLSLMRMKKDVHVVIEQEPREWSGFAALFNPPASLLNYLGSMGHLQSLTWAAWAFLLWPLHRALGGRRLLHILASFLCLCFLSYAAYMTHAWVFIRPGSEILGNRIILALLSLSAPWLLVIFLTSARIRPSVPRAFSTEGDHPHCTKR